MKLLIVTLQMLGIRGLQIGNKNYLPKLDIKMRVDEPAKILQIFSAERDIGNTWTIQDLVDQVDHNKIEGASLIVKNNVVNGLVAIDNNYKDMVDGSNLHLIRTGVPELTNKVLDILSKNNINYDIFYQRNNLEFG